MWDLVGNLEDRFSHNEARICSQQGRPLSLIKPVLTKSLAIQESHKEDGPDWANAHADPNFSLEYIPHGWVLSRFGLFVRQSISQMHYLMAGR